MPECAVCEVEIETRIPGIICTLQVSMYICTSYFVTWSRGVGLTHFLGLGEARVELRSVGDRDGTNLL